MQSSWDPQRDTISEIWPAFVSDTQSQIHSHFFDMSSNQGHYIIHTAKTTATTTIILALNNRPLHGFGRHLGCGAVAAKITANVWKILQISTLFTPQLHVRFWRQMCLWKDNDMEIISSKQEEEFKATTIAVNIFNSIQILEFWFKSLYGVLKFWSRTF